MDLFPQEYKFQFGIKGESESVESDHENNNDDYEKTVPNEDNVTENIIEDKEQPGGARSIEEPKAMAHRGFMDPSDR